MLIRTKLKAISDILQIADISYHEVHRVLLPSISHLSDLIIKGCHEETWHGGVSKCFTQLREGIWILRARQITKSLIFICNLCETLRDKTATQMSHLDIEKQNSRSTKQ